MKHLMLIMLILTGYLWTDFARAVDLAPFFVGTFEYQLDHQSSLSAQTGCNEQPTFTFCTGRNPRNELRAGAELGFGNWRTNPWIPIIQLGYQHRSGIRDGEPFNNRPESFTGSWFVEFKLGGLR